MDATGLDFSYANTSMTLVTSDLESSALCPGGIRPLASSQVDQADLADLRIQFFKPKSKILILENTVKKCGSTDTKA